MRLRLRYTRETRVAPECVLRCSGPRCSGGEWFVNAIRAGWQSLALPAPLRARGAPDCVACLDARDPAAWRIVAGLTPVQRLVRSLELEGVLEIRVLSAVPQEESALGARRPSTRARIQLLAREAPLSDTLRCLPPLAPVLALDARLVVDRRILRALLDAEKPLVVWPTPPAAGELARVRLARLDAQRLELLGRPLADVRDGDLLDPRSLSVHLEEMRGPVPILLLDVSTPADAALAEGTLVRSTQKNVMDAPARWIDPLPEDWLLRRLAPTAVTPNHVTTAGVALGALAAGLLWGGWLWAALPSMLVVGWLDGVDGKLARLKLHYSRLGELEALLDFAVENAWWIALTAFEARGRGAAAYLAGAALLGGNLADEIAYTIGHARLGRALDLLSPGDRAFRLVAGRRNIYVWVMCLAALASAPWHGFVACGMWALATASVHGMRLARAWRGAGPAPLRP